MDPKSLGPTFWGGIILLLILFGFQLIGGVLGATPSNTADAGVLAHLVAVSLIGYLGITAVRTGGNGSK